MDQGPPGVVANDFKEKEKNTEAKRKQEVRSETRRSFASRPAKTRRRQVF